MTEQEIRGSLSTSILGINVLTFESLGSTNSYARTLVKSRPPEGTLVICEDQTSGKGRFGRPWITEKGKNLTFSVLLEPGIPQAHHGVLSLMASLSVAESVRDVAGLGADCKWPNDVLVNGKKICGILSETASAGGGIYYMIVGMGINVNQLFFPPELASQATSLALETGGTVDRLRLLARVLQRLEHWYSAVRSHDYQAVIDAWKGSSVMFGKEVTVDQGGVRTTGTAEELDTGGALILRIGGEERTFQSGDVTIIR